MQKDTRNLGHKQRTILRMLALQTDKDFFFRKIKKEMTVKEITAAFGYVCSVRGYDEVCTNGEDYKRLHSLQRRGLIKRVENTKVQTYTLA